MRLVLLLLWLALTAWFLMSSSPPDLGEKPRPYVRVTAEQLATGPGRVSIMDPPTTHIGGFDQKCSDCHALFKSLDVTPSNVRQHLQVVMNHGMNSRCFNCHNKENRNTLILHDGEEIGFSESTNLCAKCHGTVFRDWERGMHGKTMGSWDAKSGKQWRFRCVDCHNPHAPQFGQVELLPGPNTPRMGEPREHDLEAQRRNPLERWKTQGHGASPAGSSHTETTSGTGGEKH